VFPVLRTFNGSTHSCYPYLRSRLSFLFSPIDYLGSTRPPFIHLLSHALRVLILPFILPPRLLLDVIHLDCSGSGLLFILLFRRYVASRLRVGRSQ
jgi:hypothetical protein